MKRLSENEHSYNCPWSVQFQWKERLCHGRPITLPPRTNWAIFYHFARSNIACGKDKRLLSAGTSEQ